MIVALKPRVKLKELVGSKSKAVLHNMRKAVLLRTLNISRTFSRNMNTAFKFIDFRSSTFFGFP